MPVIPNNYPSGLSNEEIIKVVKELSEEIIKSGANINVVLRFNPLITAGQVEIQTRLLEKNNNSASKLQENIKELKEITRRYNESSERFAKWSRLLSFLAIIISVMSLIISVYFSVKSSHSDSVWQTKQIDILQRIENKLPSMY